jgi:hypothetical protein
MKHIYKFGILLLLTSLSLSGETFIRYIITDIAGVAKDDFENKLCHIELDFLSSQDPMSKGDMRLSIKGLKEHKTQKEFIGITKVSLTINDPTTDLTIYRGEEILVKAFKNEDAMGDADKLKILSGSDWLYTSEEWEYTLEKLTPDVVDLSDYALHKQILTQQAP